MVCATVYAWRIWVLQVVHGKVASDSSQFGFDGSSDLLCGMFGNFNNT